MENIMPYSDPIELSLTITEINRYREEELKERNIKELSYAEWSALWEEKDED